MAPLDFDLSFFREEFQFHPTGRFEQDEWDSTLRLEVLELAKNLAGDHASSGLCDIDDTVSTDEALTLRWLMRDFIIRGYMVGLTPGSEDPWEGYGGTTKMCHALIELALINTRGRHS